jgi:hypothetical protein
MGTLIRRLTGTDPDMARGLRLTISPRMLWLMRIGCPAGVAFCLFAAVGNIITAGWLGLAVNVICLAVLVPLSILYWRV